MVAKNLPSDIREGVEGKVREGKTGTSNKEASKGMKEAEKENNSFKPEPSPSATPKK